MPVVEENSVVCTFAIYYDLDFPFLVRYENRAWSVPVWGFYVRVQMERW
jgi:hypothetical protein